MSARMLRQLRLAAQRIVGSELDRPVDVVRWMLAMQGQDLPGAKWSLGLRAPGTTLAEVDAAFDSGEIIRSWPMRGTLACRCRAGHRVDARHHGGTDTADR